MVSIPRYALRVGTDPNYKFKGEVEGSNKSFAPSPRYNSRSDNVAVFESVINALSYESMTVAEPSNTIALSGVSFLRLSQYLKDNPQTKHIIMMLDNDELIAKVEEDEKQSILEQIRENRSLTNRSSEVREKSVEIERWIYRV